MLRKIIIAVVMMIMTTMADAQVKSYFGQTPDIKVSGKNLVDPNGRPVVLHGIMETPNAYFNKGLWTNGVTWADYNQDATVTKCLAFFTKMFDAVANPAKGTYANLFRLHLDPCWLQDNNIKASGFTESGGKIYDPHGSEVSGEASIYHFSSSKLRTYLQKVYIPIIKDAIAHGLYVIVRPPGVFPHEIVVGDYYNQYLMTVWDIVSSDSYIKSKPGQISLELGNEPVHIWASGTTDFSQNYYGYDWKRSTLCDFFQPIVNKIRSNGFNGIIWLPGTGYQAEYRSYQYKMVNDPKNNIAFAVHFYPGWYSTTSNDNNSASSNANVLNTFRTQIPVQANYPLVVTEVDWSPAVPGSGHYDEHGSWVVSNFGTWGTGSTSERSKFGDQYKYVVDQCGNVSWTIEGADLYVDLKTYLQNGTVQPAFLTDMKAKGFKDAYEACSGAGFQWFKEYASGDKVPMPLQEGATTTYTTTATIVGNAAFDSTNGHYCFYTPYYSSFIFSDFAGQKLEDCQSLIIDLGTSTTGYRLDVQLKDASGNIIKDGDNDYIIGTEGKGTRLTTPADKVFDMQTIFADYLTAYPGCTIGDIRINTSISGEDTNKQGLYYITIDKMEMKKTYADLSDIPFYNYDNATPRLVDVTPVYNTPVTNGEVAYGPNGNVYYKEYADLTGYKRMVIKGSGEQLRVLFNRLTDGGATVELNPTLTNGEATIDLTNLDANDFVHLHSIKANWGNTATITSITLYTTEGEKTTDPEPEPEPVVAKPVTKATTWDFSDFTSNVIASDDHYETIYNDLTIVGNTAAGYQNDFISKNGFRSNGASTSTIRYIKLTAGVDGMLTVYFTSNNPTDLTRTTAIGTAVGTLVASNTVADCAQGQVSATLQAGQTYYVYFKQGGQTITKLTFAPGQRAPEPQPDDNPQGGGDTGGGNQGGGNDTPQQGGTITGSLLLTPNNSYTATADATYTQGVTYQLNILKAGLWNALYVPFAINVDSYAGDLEFAEIFNFAPTEDTNGDGKIDAQDECKLIVSPKRSGVTLPNRPYLVRAKTAGTKNIASDDNKVYAAQSATVTCSTTNRQNTFTGIYTSTVANTTNKYYYVSQRGTLAQRTADTQQLPPFSWYMVSEDVNASSKPITYKMINIDVEQ